MRKAAKPAQVKVSVAPEIAAAFKRACAASDASMAAVLTQFMAGYAGGKAEAKTGPDYSTRRRRRAALKVMIAHLEQMRCWEERVREHTPDNLQGSAAYDATEEAISSLSEAIDALAAFWSAP